MNWTGKSLNYIILAVNLICIQEKLVYDIQYIWKQTPPDQDADIEALFIANWSLWFCATSAVYCPL